MVKNEYVEELPNVRYIAPSYSNQIKGDKNRGTSSRRRGGERW
jgi:hypothetical protein